MKIYVAGKWQDRENVRLVMENVRELGHEITCDWTDHESVDKGLMEQYAISDCYGVFEADLLILVAEYPYNYRGSLVEMGIAIGQRKPVWVVGDAVDSCIFINLPTVRRFRNKEELYKALASDERPVFKWVSLPLTPYEHDAIDEGSAVVLQMSMYRLAHKVKHPEYLEPFMKGGEHGKIYTRSINNSGSKVSEKR